MEKAGVPELERRLIINLYWRQNAAVRCNGEICRDVEVEGMEGISFGGGNMTDLRYADDAVLMFNKRKKMQEMINRLSET